MAAAPGRTPPHLFFDGGYLKKGAKEAGVCRKALRFPQDIFVKIPRKVDILRKIL